VNRFIAKESFGGLVRCPLVVILVFTHSSFIFLKCILEICTRFLLVSLTYKGVIKGIVHFGIHFWYVLAYVKGIQDVCVFVSTVVSVLIF